MTAAELRVGIVGYGLAGRVFHGRLLAGTPGARVTAVVTRNPRRRAEAAADHPGVTAYDDVAAVLGAVDLLVVATPDAAHAPTAVAAIDAGVPVVVDKPLAVSAAQARAVVERAARAGVPLTVFQNRRWDSDQLTLRRLVAAGELGEVRRYESRFERWRPELNTAKWRDSLPVAEGGGQLFDLGSHLVDQAVHLFGPVDRLYAEVDARRGGSEDDVFLALTHGSGVRSHLWASAVAAAPGPRLRVLGSAGGYLVEPLDGQEDALRAGHIPGAGVPWGIEPADRAGVLRRGADSWPVPPERGRWDLFYPAVVAAVRGGGPMPVDPHEAVAVLELLEAARRSAAEREVIDVTLSGSA
jgi:predicted dehydrogenase